MVAPGPKRLSARVLRAVLVVYFVVVLAMTSLQYFVEYVDVKKNIKEELAGLEEIFVEPLTTALWASTIPQLEALANGITKLPVVTGIEIVNEDSGFQVTQFLTRKSNLFYRFQLFYTFEKKPVYLATVTIYSDSSVVFNRLKVGFFLLFAQALVLSTVLTVLFIWVIRRYLKIPLEHFVDEIESVAVEEEDGKQFVFNITAKYAEFEPLVKVLDKMGGKIAQQFQSIQNIIYDLKNNDERLRAAQEIAQLGNWDWDIINDDVYWSDATYRIFDVDPNNSSPSYKMFLKRVHPDDKSDVISSIENALYKEKPFNINHRIVLSDGTVRIVHEQGLITFDDKRKPVRMFGFVQDITERKVIENELKNNEKKYRVLVDNSLVGVFASTIDGRFIFVNDALSRMFDYDSPEQMITDGPLVLWSDPKQRSQLMNALQKYGSVTNFEAVANTHTDRHVDTLFSAQLIDDKIYGMVMDITERKQVDEKLRTSESNLLKAQEVAHIGSWNLDLIKNKLVWTDENYRIFEVSRGTQMTYEKFLELVHPDDRKYVDKKWAAAIAGEEPYDIEHRLLIGDELKWVQEKAELIFDDKGNPISGLGTTHEITRRKLAEIDLQQLAGRLISIQEDERRRLARELHDDLAQRLALMSIEADKFNAEGCNPEAHGVLQNLKDKLIDLSEDVHRISRQLHPSIIEDLGLEEALKSEINNFSRLEEIPVKLEYELGTANPSLDRAVSLFRVTQESLRNIKKHAHAENVTIKLVNEDGSLLLTIIDDGRGFNSDIVKTLPGLGLKSMRERMRLIGGSISYISRQGYGTTVKARIDIPS